MSASAQSLRASVPAPVEFPRRRAGAVPVAYFLRIARTEQKNRAARTPAAPPGRPYSPDRTVWAVGKARSIRSLRLKCAHTASIRGSVVSRTRMASAPAGCRKSPNESRASLAMMAGTHSGISVGNSELFGQVVKAGNG